MGRRVAWDAVADRASSTTWWCANAVIADGTGGPLFDGDVAVSDGSIAALGPTSPAGGSRRWPQAVRWWPRFIDPHTHLDANLFWDPDLTPSSSFGVTTVVTSNCGYGLAPVVDQAARRST